MKKLVNSKIVFLLIVLLFAGWQANATDYYVSPNGSGNGSGNSDLNTMAYSNFYQNIIYGTPPSDNVVNVYFERGATAYDTGQLGFTNTGLNRTVWNGKTLNFDQFGNDPNPVVFTGVATNIFTYLTLARGSGTRFTLSVKNIILQNFSDENANHFISISGYNSLILDHVTIRNNNNTNATARLLVINGANAELTMSNSSITGNNRGSVNLMYFQVAGRANIYNNTFSNNVCQFLYVLAASTRFFNNTLYNSGVLRIEQASAMIVNNVAVGSSYIDFPATTAALRNGLYRNISGTSYWDTRDTQTLSFPNILTFINATPDGGTEPGSLVHRLADIYAAGHPIIDRGGTITDVRNKVGITLSYDQIGRTRPSPMSLGAVEAILFEVKDDPVVSVLYNSTASPPTSPDPVGVDLSTFLTGYPLGVISGTTTFTINDAGLSNGTIVQSTHPTLPL